MDFTEFINSKDIREYHKEINYEYSPLQAAWLIYQSARNTITEKHRAWKELIDTMPDCLMQDKGYIGEVMHLHDFLKRYMEVQNNCLERFRNKDGSVYQLKYYCRGDHDWCEGDAYYSDLAKCWDEVVNERDLDIIRVRITKYMIDEERRSTVVEYTPDGEPLEIYECGLENDELNDLDEGFTDLWLEFPFPFKIGDIVAHVDHKYPSQRGIGDPFVLKSLPDGYGIENPVKTLETSDMIVTGHFLDDQGYLYSEHTTSNYMDLVLYDKPLEGKERALKIISRYVKGQIELEHFLNAYRKILLEEMTEDVWMVGFYPINKMLDGAEVKEAAGTQGED